MSTGDVQREGPRETNEGYVDSARGVQIPKGFSRFQQTPLEALKKEATEKRRAKQSERAPSNVAAEEEGRRTLSNVSESFVAGVQMSTADLAIGEFNGSDASIEEESSEKGLDAVKPPFEVTHEAPFMPDNAASDGHEVGISALHEDKANTATGSGASDEDLPRDVPQHSAQVPIPVA